MLQQAFADRRDAHWFCVFCLPALVILLSSCSFFGPTASTKSVSPGRSGAWSSYHGKGFTMNYWSNWEVATKDLYLGASYPQLEMLQGMIFFEQGNPTTFVQVVYASNVGAKASVDDLLCKYVLGTVKHPLAVSKLTTISLAAMTWSQGIVEKQVSATGSPGGSMLMVRETAQAVNYTGKNGQTLLYLIIYQDANSTYDKTAQTFFAHMISSFHFVG